METAEKQWIREYLQGNVDSLAQLIEQTRGPLFAYISKMMRGHPDSEEIFQEVWIRAARNLDRYRDERFLSWLCRIAHNLIIDRFRKDRRMNSLDEPFHEGGPALADQLQDQAPSPCDQVAASDLQSAVAAAVARLPPEQREVFLLRTEADMPFKEIARLQGVSINTALARMQYAVRKLRSELRDLDPAKVSHEPRSS